MSTTSGVKTAPSEAVAQQSVTWHMWVPCLAMAACSWLSFVDRQVLGALAPTILKETGMNAQEFAGVSAYFFVAYTLANPIWGSVIDYIGLRTGMFLGVLIWTIASVSHGWMATFAGFAVMRAVLGFGEGVTFPGGLRTAVVSLPATLRARAIALSFSGGTLGSVAASLIAVPVAQAYGGSRAAFIVTGALGAGWLLLWLAVSRPPFLPKVEQKAKKLAWPNPFEQRFWALVFSYALPAIAPGPILTLFSLYLSQGLAVPQADLAWLLPMPSLSWGVGYFFWGWAADRFAADNRRPVGMFALLTACSLLLGTITWVSSVPFAIAVASFATFIGGGFQMVALKVGSYSFPREQAAMMTGIASGSWSLANYIILQFLGPLFNQQRYSEAFWLIALCPLLGITAWLILSSRQTTQTT
jgi:ACS family hexuronate transporter-like MFS transporter